MTDHDRLARLRSCVREGWPIDPSDAAACLRLLDAAIAKLYPTPGVVEIPTDEVFIDEHGWVWHKPTLPTP